MVTHWESSSRPLFIKTVWRDGQHHVVLSKEEESNPRRNNIRSSSNRSSARSVRSAKNNKKVSSASVKLLLTGVSKFNQSEKKVLMCKGNVKSPDALDWKSPREPSSTFKNVKQALNTSLHSKANTKLNLSIKSKSIDINIERENYNKIGSMTPYFNYYDNIESHDTSLSERVMVWLDLATQNGNYTKEAKKQPQRVVTACQIPQDRQYFASIDRRNFLNYQLTVNRRENRNVFYVEGVSQEPQSINSAVSNHSSVEEEYDAILEEDNVLKKHQLSSQLEENTLEWYKQLSDIAPSVPKDNLKQLVSCAFALLSKESSALGLPDFPIDNLPLGALIMEQNPHLSAYEIIYRLYPYRTFLKDEESNIISLFSKFGVKPPADDTPYYNVTNEFNNMLKTNKSKMDKYIETSYQNSLLESMLQTIKVSDFCIIGPSGCGKSLLVNKLAQLLNQEVENIVLYQDMTSRDLIQQRTTLNNGDTVWKFSPLVTCALDGKIAILDGIDRIHPSTLTVLHRLVHDRELQLYDGRRLISSERYNFLKENLKFTTEKLTECGILKIHPDFKIIAIGEPPNAQVASGNWITPELLSFFIFHEMRTLSKQEEIHIIASKFGPISKTLYKLIELAHILRFSQDTSLNNLAGHLSTRQLLRIATRLKHFPDNNLYNIIQEIFMMKFLPSLTRHILEKTINNMGISPDKNKIQPNRIKCDIKDNILTIGNTSAPIYNSKSIIKVPNILFYDVPQHLLLMEKLLQDFQLGFHLLLVGNQGVGKNKIADRFLEILNRPREYIQLHRDTTVQTLTTQATILDGQLIYEDSALVKAVKHGRVLVIDEADKAPIHVTCILKTLVESGQMILSDGRKIVSFTPDVPNPDYIKIHPDFRLIVLANRPGFPFLGNDFFGALGDLFSSHAVDNPSKESEIELLKQYGPHVPLDTVENLVNIFGELRNMADQGLLNYPYSTREVVNIVKHLEQFPQSDIEDVVFNVFDFDKYSPELIDTLGEVLVKHGFSNRNVITAEYAAAKRAKENIQVTVKRYSGLETKGPKHGKEDPKNEPHVGGNTWAGGTGGRDTAGLGGKGGPYRLDKGHKVHQLSDEEKNAVPEHIQKAAREMGRKAFQEKLKEIGMSGYDHSIYSQFFNAVAKQVQSLRVILSNLQAKNKERQWYRHQTSGELDDIKLIDGLLGEKTIFRRRSEQEPELGTPQLKPKLFRVVVDVSGSMYRFNSYDGRLDRELEAVVLIMEAFEGFEHKIKYDILGHSGEAPNIVFVKQDDPPKNNKERLDTIRTMHAHSQYCWSGDHTLESTQWALTTVAEEDYDEAIVVVLSDANLQRYGIPPSELAEALTCKKNVKSYVIFIGSLGDQAERLLQQLPAGRAFICSDTSQLPQILNQIFSSSVINV